MEVSVCVREDGNESRGEKVWNAGKFIRAPPFKASFNTVHLNEFP